MNNTLTFRHTKTGEVVTPDQFNNCEVGLYEITGDRTVRNAYVVNGHDFCTLVVGFSRIFTDEELEQFDDLHGFEYIKTQRHALDYINAFDRFYDYV